MKVVMRLQKETKGALLYSVKEEDQNDTVGPWSQYIRKFAARKEWGPTYPKAVEVEIRALSEDEDR